MPEQPDLILTPFGENAPSGAIDTIPEQRSPGDPPQRASWQDGFPTVTMQPLASGGIPPRGQDFNGVLNAISQHLVYLAAGGVYRWSDEYVAAHGGYSQGAVLQSDDGLSTYISAIDGNTVNFNTTPSAIGNQWMPAGGASKANSSLTINAGAGLGGGGNLSANRTLFVDFASEEQAKELSISNKVISPLNLGQALGDLGQNIAVFDTAGVTNWTVPEVLRQGLRKAHVIVIGGGGGTGSGRTGGGTSSFGTRMTANGGQEGGTEGTSSPGGIGGAATGGSLNIQGSRGGSSGAGRSGGSGGGSLFGSVGDGSSASAPGAGAGGDAGIGGAGAGGFAEGVLDLTGTQTILVTVGSRGTGNREGGPGIVIVRW